MIHPNEMKDFEAAIVQGGFDFTDFDARQLLHLPGATSWVVATLTNSFITIRPP